MTYFEPIARCDKLGTVPERGCRFDSGAVNKGCNQKGQPTYHVVHNAVLFHQKIFFNVKNLLAKVLLYNEK